MTTVTGLTAARMAEIEAASIVDAELDGDELVLTKQDGTPINVGVVKGPPGPDTEAAIEPIIADVVVLQENSPMGAVKYARDYLEKVPAVYDDPAEAIEAAMADTESYGGPVVLPGGAPIEMPPRTLIRPIKPIMLCGSGEMSTHLSWATDLAAGQWAIDSVDQIRHIIQDLSVTGPENAIIDGTHADMWGIRHLSRNELRNVRVNRFKGGITTAGDHHFMQNIRANNCRDGIYMMAMGVGGVDTDGNQYIKGPIDVTGNSRFGICFGPSSPDPLLGSNINGAHWDNIHFGMGPGAFGWEVDENDIAASVVGLTLDALAFENVGGALFYCMSDNPVGSGILVATILNSMYSQYPGAGSVHPIGYRSAGLRNMRAHVDGLAGVNLTLIDSDIFSMGAVDTPKVMQYGGYCNLDISGRWTRQTLDAMIAENGKIYVLPNSFPGPRASFREDYGRAEMHYCDAVGITAGRAVYRSADGGVRPWIAGKEVYGVALQSGAAYAFIPIAKHGIWPITISATTAVAAGDAIIPDLATADSKFTKAAAGAGMSIAVAMETIAAGATGRADITPTNYRFA